MPIGPEVRDETRAEEPTCTGRIRAVVVDDDAQLLEIVCASLERHSLFEVVGTGQNGVEALHLTAALSPDLVIMDILMPQMSGIEAARIMAKDFPATKVVLMSGDDSFQRDGTERALSNSFIFKGRFWEEHQPVLQKLFPGHLK